MDRRTYLATTGAVLGGSVAGCVGDSGSGGSNDGTEDGSAEDGDGSASQTGVLSTAVSDDPADIGDFERLVVTVDEVWVHPKKTDDEGGDETEEEESGDEDAEQGADDGEAGNETDGGDEPMDGEEAEGGEDESEEGEESEGEEEQEGDDESEGESDGEEDSDDGGDGKIIIDAGGAEADLVQLQGDAQKVINSAELDVGTYEQIKLWVGDDVDAVLNDGSETDVMTPGNAPLKFNKEFEIRANTETTFTADFAPHKRGPNGYVLKPVATEVRVEYNEIQADDDSGTDNESGMGNESDDSDMGNESDDTSTDNESA